MHRDKTPTPFVTLHIPMEMKVCSVKFQNNIISVNIFNFDDIYLN